MPPDNDVRAAQPALRDRILEGLRARPDQKAIELAQSLGVERREVNRCLTYDLRGKVVQNSAYRWRLSSPQAVAGPTPARPVAPPTELGRLCRYYLECVGPDSDQGVSCFASSNFGDPDYAELPALPMSSSDWEWWNAPGVGRVLSRVRADSSNLVAWMGYPIRLREHQTPN